MTSLRSVIAVLAGLIAAPAAAQVCVACNEPSAAYRCVVDDPAAAGPAGERAIQFVCVTELARRFGHGTCWVRRDLVPGCDAGEQRVSIGAALAGPPPPLPPAPGADAPSSVAGADPAAKPAPLAPPAAPKPPPDPGVPQTMEEVARRTAASSGRELEKAGSALKKTGQAVGDVFDLTVTCITSLFQKCRSDKPQ